MFIYWCINYLSGIYINIVSAGKKLEKKLIKYNNVQNTIYFEYTKQLRYVRFN